MSLGEVKSLPRHLTATSQRSVQSVPQETTMKTICNNPHSIAHTLPVHAEPTAYDLHRQHNLQCLA